MSEPFDSTDDQRTDNNTMRHQYRTLSDEEKQGISDLKGIGQVFIDGCNELGDSRELLIAKTKMEEAVMWSVKHITN